MCDYLLRGYLGFFSTINTWTPPEQKLSVYSQVYPVPGIQ